MHGMTLKEELEAVRRRMTELANAKIVYWAIVDAVERWRNNEDFWMACKGERRP